MHLDTIAITSRFWPANLCFCAALACAYSPSAWALDVEQAYRAALENDATIRASRANAQANRESLPQAQALRQPSVSFNSGRTRNDLTSQSRNILGQPTTTQNDYYSGSQTLSVRMPLYRPEVSAGVRQATAQVAQADASLAADEQTLVIRVGEAYFNALQAEDQVSLVDILKRTFTVQLDAAERRFKAGAGVRTDVDEAKAQLDMTLAQELELRQNVDFSRRNLELLTAQPVESLKKLNVQQFAALPPMTKSLQSWVEQAEQSSFELAALRAQVEAAQQAIDKAQAGHKPTLDVVAQWSRTSSDSVVSINSRYDNKTIGLQLNVPIYSGGYVSSTVRQAVAQHTRALEALEASRRDLGVRVHREFRTMTEGLLRIAALEQAVRSADQAVLSNHKSFEGGSRTMLEVLSAEKSRHTALRDLSQARYAYLLARLRLQSLAGEDRNGSVAQLNSVLE